MSRFLLSLMAVLFVSVSAFSQAAKKEWTLLVFINGHNNLSSYAEMNIKDMEKIGSNQDLNIIAEWGAADTHITKRLYIEKSTDDKNVTSPVVKELVDYDMGNYKNLQSFIRWGVQNYPAHHYMIVVWNHGAGWHRKTLSSVKDISFDDNTGNHITTEQLGLVMADAKNAIGHNVDIYGSDACLMQMIEVAGEMKDSVDFFVGSQETEPAEGWPYETFLKKWSEVPNMTPKEVSILLSKEYKAAYSPGGIYPERSDITFSAWDLSKLDGLYSAIKNLGTNLKSLGTAGTLKLKKAAIASTRFLYTDYADLGDFLNQTKAAKISKVDSGLLDAVTAGLNDVILTTDNSSSYPRATGLSIWLPVSGNQHQARYQGLQFAKATGWGSITLKLSK